MRPALASIVCVLSMQGCSDAPTVGMLRSPLAAYCTINVTGKGTKDVETDYLPHVVACENGNADTEALKAQAVAARTFAYYKIATAGAVKDGTGDQVYTCATQPSQKHYDAATATSGQVLVYSGVVICSFFVAGAKPAAASCVAAPGDPDPTGTEKYVTYNEGKSGSQVTQSSLGWVDPSNKYNRGCLSQNGSHCLSLNGRPYTEIMPFYYGDDALLVTATGSCVNPPPPPPDKGPPPPDSGVARLDSRPGKLDGVRLDGRASMRDGGWVPFQDQGDQELPLVVNRLRGGCSVEPGLAGGAEAALPLAVLALLLLARRRFTRQTPSSSS
jgi:MYXO-CTERM domain-containing protein